MDKKSLVVMISVGVLLIIAIALLICYVASGGSLKTTDIIGKTEELSKPIIELFLNSEKYTTESVIINIKTYMEDGSEIESIILPNNQEVISTETMYEVTKNGEYEFIVKGKNGGISKQTIEINNILDSSSDVPYIPADFEHVEGTEVSSGYTIIDKYGNEFVWIPVSTGILTRESDGDNKYEENTSEISEFINSVQRYYGFYVAKYEASLATLNGKETIAFKANVIPLSNVNYRIAYDKSQKMCEIYKYNGVKTSLINSYAWDTTLKWINKSITNYSKNISYGNYSGIIFPTGDKKSDIVNNICDLAGNLREWTTEMYYTSTETETTDIYRVIRGGSANIEKVASSHIAYPDYMTDTYWGFRAILYKEL